MLTKEDKQELIKKYGSSEKDSGNIKVQIAVLTARIQYLTEHFRTHIHDNHSRRGLLKLVGQRKSLLNYLRKNSTDEYLKLIGELGIRK